jgi:hypothetical protein
LLARSTIAERLNGNSAVIVAVDDSSCRVMLVSASDQQAGKTQFLDALVKPGSGWVNVPALTGSKSGVERRAYLKRDAGGQPYLLNVMTPDVTVADLRFWTTLVRIPPNVSLPEGF